MRLSLQHARGLAEGAPQMRRVECGVEVSVAPPLAVQRQTRRERPWTGQAVMERQQSATRAVVARSGGPTVATMYQAVAAERRKRWGNG